MENKKGSLLTVFLVIAIILIGVMGVFMYMQKTEADRQIAELENSINEIKEATKEKEPNIKDEETDIKDNENELPNSEEVNSLVTKFLEMLYARESGFESILEKIGYDNPQEIYNNTVKSDNDGDSIYGVYNKNMDKYVGGYSNTKIKYSDFEEKISNYMTPGIVEQCFGGKFVEYNGFLYAFIGNASGAGVSNVTVQSIYNNIYLVKYSVSDEAGTDEYECIIRITNYNNKNVVSGFMG